MRSRLLPLSKAARAYGVSLADLRSQIDAGAVKTVLMAKVPVDEDPSLPQHPGEILRTRCHQIMELPGIGAVDRLVLMVFAWHENYSTGLIFVSGRRLIRLTGTSRSTVERALARLQRAGLIGQVEPARWGQQPAVYRFGDQLFKMTPSTSTYSTAPQIEKFASFAPDAIRDDPDDEAA